MGVGEENNVVGFQNGNFIGGAGPRVEFLGASRMWL